MATDGLPFNPPKVVEDLPAKREQIADFTEVLRAREDQADRQFDDANNARLLWKCLALALLIGIAAQKFSGFEVMPDESGNRLKYHSWKWWGIQSVDHNVQWKRLPDEPSPEWKVETSPGQWSHFFKDEGE